MKVFNDAHGETIVEDQGRLHLREDGGKTTFLCAVSPELAIRPHAWDSSISSLGKLSETIPKMVQGKCPACSAKLEVINQGRYRCEPCTVTFANDVGYRLSALLSEEILRGVVDGRTVSEFTTVGLGSVMPSGVGDVIEPEKRYADICPKCFSDLNRRGECGKCGWVPDDVRKLWEHVVRVMSRSVQINYIGERVLEFENNEDVCKLYLKETKLGHKFSAQLKNVSRDTTTAIVGRHKAIINWVVEQVGSKPVRPVNSPTVNSPIQETGHRLHTRERGKDTVGLSYRNQPKSSFKRRK